ncbi:MAG: strawberry notch C-terminal domain-containing protein [Bacteroidia bacterium]
MRKNKTVELARKMKMINELGMPYIPASEACNSLQVDVPDSMAFEMHEALKRVRYAVGGSINDFVTDRLGYGSNIELCKALAAEQIDGVALAIYNIEAKGQALIIGDQTGIGKGRQAAAMIRYGVKRGLKPIFITEKPNLFSDLYRDLVAIGSAGLKPFIVNGREAKTHIKDEDGNIIYQAEAESVQKSIFESRKVPADCDFVVLTYSQIATNETNDKGEIIALSKKAAFIDSIAEGNTMVIDEAHNASGNSNTGKVLRDIVAKTIGVTFLSATFAKRPDNMPIYALKTAISEANMSSEELIEAIEKGGVALQEILSSQLVKEGQMLRRERTYEGIKVNYLTLDELEEQHRKISDQVTEIMRDIIDLQVTDLDKVFSEMDDIAKAEYKEVETRKGTKKAGVDNTPYFSKVFNVINQMLFSIKADSVADLAIKHLKEGRKPVIAFSSTMGSFLDDLGVAEGDTINADFSVVLQKGLDGVLRYSEKDSSGKSEYKTLKLQDLSPETRMKYMAIQEKINKVSTGISISPIDLIIQKIRKAGYSITEVTGRKYKLQLNLVSVNELKTTVPPGKQKGVKISDFSSKLKRFMPKIQQTVVIGNEELHDVVDRLNKEVAAIPVLYSTEKLYNKQKKGNNPQSFNDFAIAKAHFFVGSTDWYVLEWDGSDTIWGYCILNGDYENAEYGYASLSELFSIRVNNAWGVELDFYFNQKSISELLLSKGVAGINGCDCPKRSNKYKRFLGLVDTSAEVRKYQAVISLRKRVATNDAFRDFNNNEVDCLMINQSGSTGASAHAIPTNKVPKDKVKQRVMLVLQSELDINTEVQKRGRVNRTGQILKPQYDYVSSAIPAEKRLMMMLQKKLKSLDANTTSNQKNSEKLMSVPDFLNKIGDKVVFEYLQENLWLNTLLDDPLKMETEKYGTINELIENFAHKVSGRVAVLSTKMQSDFYSEITKRYDKRVEYLKQTGEYDLEVEAMDLQAETIDTMVLRSGKGGRSSFGDDSILEKVYANVLKKPFTKKELDKLISEQLKGRDAKSIQADLITMFETFVAETLKQDFVENETKYKKLVDNVPNEKKIVSLPKELQEREILLRVQELETAKGEQAKAIEKKSKNNADYMRQFFNYFYVGRGINYPLISFGEGATTYTKAVFLGVEIDYERKNPYAPSAVGFKFALSDSNKYIELVASGETGQMLNQIMGASVRLSPSDGEIFLKDWDEITKTSNVNRKVRYIVTGNLLQAFTDSKGKLISYTTKKKGEVLKGILYPENYDPNLSANSHKVNVPIIAAAKLVKSVAVGVIITTTNGISITRNQQGKYVIMVAGTKKKGGFLFLDTEVLSLVEGNNFEKISDTMRAFVDARNIDNVLKLLQDKHNTSVSINANLYESIKSDIDKVKKNNSAKDTILFVKPKPIQEELNIESELELEAMALELELELLNF